MENSPGKIPPPPGLIASLAAGFDSVANSITVIALPVLFDLFLWFGPHLRLYEFLQPAIVNLPRLYSSMTSVSNLEIAQEFWTDFLTRFNLFAGLRTFPVGTSSLLFLEMPLQTPLGTPAILEARSFLGMVGGAILIMLAGWLIGALYFHWVSSVALKSEARSLWKSISQTLFLSLIWMTLLFAAGLPALVLASLATLVSPMLGQIALFMVGLFAIWLVMPVYFSTHGIFTFQMDAVSAILNSLRLVRFTLPTSGLFLFLLIVISQGLRFLWSTPPSDSWWLLVGILGHAFISTALLASSFIYYRNVNGWLQVVFEHMKTQRNSVHV